MSDNPCLSCGVDVRSCTCEKRCKKCLLWGFGNECIHKPATSSNGLSISPEWWLKSKGLLNHEQN